MASVHSNVLSATEVSYLHALPEVITAKASLDARPSGTVRFSVAVTDTIKAALKGRFYLDVGPTIPMRWIKGDTAPHVDAGASNFTNTYLVYLTSSPGTLIVDSQTYPIEANTGIVFNEGLTHETQNTVNIPRLILGPMNEHAEPVGSSIVYYPTEADALAHTNAIGGGLNWTVGSGGPFGTFTTWRIASNSYGSSPQNVTYPNGTALIPDGSYYLYPALYTLTKPRRWFNIVQDGNGGEAGRLYGSMGHFISTNTSVDANGRTSISTMYIDKYSNYCRQLYGRSPDTNAQDIILMETYSQPLNQLILNGSAVDIGSAAATVTTSTDPGTLEYVNYEGRDCVHIISAADLSPHISIPNTFTNTSFFTISFWYHLNQNNNYWPLINLVGGQFGLSIAFSNTGAITETMFYIGTTDSYEYGFGSFTPPTPWTHIVLTYANGAINYYINGVLLTNANYASAFTFSELIIGGIDTSFFAAAQAGGEGYIRQVCVFDSALSATRITELYNGTEGNEVVQGNPIRSFVGYSNLATSEWFGYTAVNDTLSIKSNAVGATWDLALSSINTPTTNVKLRKCCVGTSQFAYISVGNSIYKVFYDSGIYTEVIVDDYAGYDYHVASYDGSVMYMCYTTKDTVKVVVFDSTGGVTTVIGTLLLGGTNPNCQPRLVVRATEVFLFVIKNKMLHSTIINLSTSVISIGPRIVHVQAYLPIATPTSIYIVGINRRNRLFEFEYDPYGLIKPKFIILDNRAVANNVFDVCTINEEQYIYYQDSDNNIRQLWNPINRINIKFAEPVTSLTATVGTNTLFPAFSTTITDYGIQTDEANNHVTYSLSVVQASGTTVISEAAYPNQLLTVSDNIRTYYIRLHPINTLYGGSITKNIGYNPGYYLTADTSNSNDSPYFTIYDSNGVPVWWRRVTSDPNYQAIDSVCALQKGNGKNRVITLIFDTARPRTVIDIATLEEANYVSLPPSGGGGPLGWDVHESLELDGPPARKGNILHAQYVNGFYLQEQNTDHVRTWDFYSTSAWPSTDPEWFHINAMSVHPTTGDIICSFRTNSSVACINYATKNVDWVIDPTNGCWQYLNDPSLTKNLTIQGEPTILGSQYNGTDAQHDCRWHPEIAPLTSGNQVISIFDNQSFGTLPAARGVIYEIDLTNDLCIWRGNCYSETGTSGYMGSYRINAEADGTTSHVANFVQQHPQLIEYSGTSNGMPSQNIIFEMDLPGDLYRIDKATPDQIDIAAMRRTAGMPYSTPYDFVPWTPAGSPNIQVWFDGNDIQANGYFVADNTVNTAWQDKSGNNYHASGGTGNTYTTKTFIKNGLSVQRMTATANVGASANFDASTSYTIFTTQRRLGSAGDWALLLNGYNGGTMTDVLYYGTHVSTTNLFATSDEASLEVDTPIVDLVNWCVLSLTVTGSTNQVYLNGVALNPRTGVSVSTISGIYIGSLYSGGQMWEGDIGDIIIYNGVLSTGDRQKVEGFLAWKWGLQSGLPSDHPYKYFAPIV